MRNIFMWIFVRTARATWCRNGVPGATALELEPAASANLEPHPHDANKNKSPLF